MTVVPIPLTMFANTSARTMGMDMMPDLNAVAPLMAWNQMGTQ